MQFSEANLHRCRVKVCGVRDPLEAEALEAMHVDWIGFNFYPGSPRYLPPEAATPLVSNLHRAMPVGVFVDANPEEVIRIIQITGIRYVQLHGHEDWDYVMKMPVPVIKAIPHDRLFDLGGLRDSLAGSKERVNPLAYFLVDTQASKSGSGFGGSGKSFDWGMLAHHTIPLPYFLAGGLGPENLAQALASSKPFAVDLNSKVETSPGRKDLEKVKACVDMAHGKIP